MKKAWRIISTTAATLFTLAWIISFVGEGRLYNKPVAQAYFTGPRDVPPGFLVPGSQVVGTYQQPVSSIAWLIPTTRTFSLRITGDLFINPSLEFGSKAGWQPIAPDAIIHIDPAQRWAFAGLIQGHPLADN